MKSKDYVIETGNRSGEKKFTLHVEQFSSCAEVVSVCSHRDLQLRSHRDIDYFGNAKKSKDPDWNGFRSADDMKDRLKVGLKDKDIVKDVNKFVYSARVPDVMAYAAIKREVYGGGVDVPRYLTGSPDCMLMLQKKKRKSDVINVGVNCLVTAGISKEVAKEVGALVARAIFSVEKAGYRVNMDALALHGDNNYRYAACLRVPIKKSDAALSIPRLLYPLCDMSFARGVSFGWAVQDQTMSDSWGLSQRIDCLFSGPDKSSRISDMYSTILGEDAIYLDFNLLVDRYYKDKSPEGKKNLEQYIISRFIGTE